ncbi:MAG: radical SAM/SPASM domain-containing protein [Kiritimatiellales bacterium]
MNKQTRQLIQMLMDPRITAKPLWVLAQLRAKGIRRIPDEILTDLKHAGRQGHALSFIHRWLNGEQFTRHNGQWVLNSFLPPFPGPGYYRMFDNLLSGRHLSPVSVFIAVTSHCPCRCAHCSAHRPTHEELTTPQWIEVLRQLKDLGTSLVGFTGGEPLTHTGLFILVEECRRLEMDTILFTSGAGISEEHILRLKRAGLWSCCISLDSDKADVHDRMRGRPDTYNEALETIRLSLKHGLYTMASSVASQSFVDQQTFKQVHALCKQLGVHEYRIVEPMPCGAFANAAENDMTLSSEQIRTLRNFHIQTNRTQQTPKVCSFNQIESPEIFGCGAGTQHFYIQPDGIVCPCDFTPLGFGNVRNESLSDIWKRMNRAMGGNPRRYCFIQKHHRLINQHATSGAPLPVEVSEAICAEAGTESLPDYFAMVTGQQAEPTK